MEEESIKKNKFTNGLAADSDISNGSVGNNTKKSSKSAPPELRLHELRAETYNGMVRLLKPGCRTIVLLVDSQSRNQLLAAFHKIVWPYRRLVYRFTYHFYYKPIIHPCPGSCC